jgi:hypothetical protein
VFRRLRYVNLKSAGAQDSTQVSTEGDGALDRLPFALGIPGGVLQPGTGEREGWCRKRSGLFPTEPSGAGSAGEGLEELNALLLEGCRANEQRRIAGKPHTVGEAMQIEREHLQPLAAEGFDLAETSFPVVDSKGCVRVLTQLVFPLRLLRARARE